MSSSCKWPIINRWLACFTLVFLRYFGLLFAGFVISFQDFIIASVTHKGHKRFPTANKHNYRKWTIWLMLRAGITKKCPWTRHKNEKNSRVRYKARNKSVTTNSCLSCYYYLISFKQLHLLRLKVKLSSSQSITGLLSLMAIAGTVLD